ncbi:Myb-like_DNA-binding domain-containing protein [Hexamita inflata]|uniref:Myb-like DNA-binding domain-containing protein n=1 Tax=Hexamita inflata TaxID=28002 RepID=A0AA86PMQ8_9EUKA|nr:Myb-like DNA-binding domain-containing protein [Hexamita inflata]
MKRNYQRWTPEEKLQLLNVVKNNQNYNGKIYWDLVQKQFPNRTAVQCKHYYQSITIKFEPLKENQVQNNLQENKYNLQVNANQEKQQENQLQNNKPNDKQDKESVKQLANQNDNQSEMKSKQEFQNEAQNEEVKQENEEDFLSAAEMFGLYLVLYKYGWYNTDAVLKYFPHKSLKALEQPLDQARQCKAFYSDVFIKLSKDQTVILSQFEHKLLLIVLYLLQYRYQLYLNPTMKQMPPYPLEMKKMIENMDLDKFLLKTELHEIELYQIERADRLYGVPKLISAIPLLEKWYADLYGKDFSSTQ